MKPLVALLVMVVVPFLTSAKILMDEGASPSESPHRQHIYELVAEKLAERELSTGNKHNIYDIMTDVVRKHHQTLDKFFEYTYHMPRVRFWGTHKTWIDEIWLHSLDQLDHIENHFRNGSACVHCGCLRFSSAHWEAYTGMNSTQFRNYVDKLNNENLHHFEETRALPLPCPVILRIPWMRARHFQPIMEYLRGVLSSQLLRGVHYISVVEDDIGAERLIGYDIVNWGVNITLFMGNSGRESSSGLNVVQIPPINGHYSRGYCEETIADSRGHSDGQSRMLSFVGLFGTGAVSDPTLTRIRAVTACVNQLGLKSASCLEWRYGKNATHVTAKMGNVVPFEGRQTWCATVRHLQRSTGKFLYYRGPEWTYALCSSAFSLAPRGNGPTSYRLYELLQLGIPPVYIWKNRIDLPFSKLADNSMLPEDHWIPINPTVSPPCVQLQPNATQTDQPHCWRWKDLAYVWHIDDFESRGSARLREVLEEGMDYQREKMADLASAVTPHYFLQDAVVKHMLQFVKGSSWLPQLSPISKFVEHPSKSAYSPLVKEEINIARALVYDALRDWESQLHVAPEAVLVKDFVPLIISASVSEGVPSSGGYTTENIAHWKCDEQLSFVQYCGGLSLSNKEEVQAHLGTGLWDADVLEYCKGSHLGEFPNFKNRRTGSFLLRFNVSSPRFRNVREVASYVADTLLSRGIVPHASNTLTYLYGSDFVRRELARPPDHVRIFPRDIPHSCFPRDVYSKMSELESLKRESEAVLSSKSLQDAFLSRSPNDTYKARNLKLPEKIKLRRRSILSGSSRGFTSITAETRNDEGYKTNEARFPQLLQKQNKEKSVYMFAVETVASYLQYLYSFDGIAK